MKQFEDIAKDIVMRKTEEFVKEKMQEIMSEVFQRTAIHVQKHLHFKMIPVDNNAFSIEVSWDANKGEL